MAWGQQSAAAAGPPASPKQVAYLQVLLEKAGYGSFRDARQPLGLTQRQASGKFSSRDASALIDRLVNGEAPTSDDAAQAGLQDDKVLQSQAAVLRGIPAQLLADELLRRGWSVQEPG